MRHPPLQSHIALGLPVWNLSAGFARVRESFPRWRQATRDGQLRFLQTVYRHRGGLASADEVAGLMQDHWDQTVSTVARWIVARSVLCFASPSQTLLPLFQFDRADMSLRPCVTAVLGELGCAFDDWELALWFAEPNSWLGDAVPAELVITQPEAVLKAAQADRFIARG